MKALILVGGFGTRLRPLTLTLPKPLVPFANKPMILHQIEALVKVGVTDIILAVNYRPEIMVSHIQDYESLYNIRITFSVETEPLGTAGPLALARAILKKDDEPFFVLNSDIICEFPFKALMEAHKSTGAEGTIVVTKVEEPSKYGVIVMQKSNASLSSASASGSSIASSTLIERFVEKPKEFVSNRINAGIYLLNVSVLDRIELKPTSIEKDVFPYMAQDRKLHAFDLDGFWMDVGQPKDFLLGTGLYLTYLHRISSSHGSGQTAAKSQAGLSHLPDISQLICHGEGIVGANLIHPTAKIGKGCRIGPNVVLGANVIIGDGVRISRSVIMEGAKVDSFAWISNTIAGWNSRIGHWVRLEGVSVLGDDVSIADELYVNGGCILPHKSISHSISEPQIIM